MSFLNYVILHILLLTSSAEDPGVDHNYQYVPTPKTYDEAEQYCLDIYETHLATIISAQDLQKALIEIDSNVAPWIGLHSTHKSGWFEYFDGEVCIEPFTGACLPSEQWVTGTPLDCDTGSRCVTLYPSVNKVNNDRQCNEQRPFLCSGPGIIPREYVYGGKTIGWGVADLICAMQFGTKLASFVYERDYENFKAVADTTGENIFMVGLYQPNDRNGDWVWSDGTPCTKTDGSCTGLWVAGEPNNEGIDVAHGDADCATFSTAHNGIQHDWPCTYIAPFMCNAPTSNNVINIGDPLMLSAKGGPNNVIGENDILINKDMLKELKQMYGDGTKDNWKNVPKISDKISAPNYVVKINEPKDNFWALLGDEHFGKYFLVFIIVLTGSLTFNALFTCLYCNRRNSVVLDQYDPVAVDAEAVNLNK